jgi:hypothetical protein
MLVRARHWRAFLQITDGGTPSREGGFPDPARKSVPSRPTNFHATVSSRSRLAEERFSVAMLDFMSPNAPSKGRDFGGALE